MFTLEPYDPTFVRIVLLVVGLVAALLLAVFLVSRNYGRSPLDRYVRLYDNLQRRRRDLIARLDTIHADKDAPEGREALLRELYRIDLASEVIRRKVLRTWGIVLSSRS